MKDDGREYQRHVAERKARNRRLMSEEAKRVVAWTVIGGVLAALILLFGARP